MKENGFYRTIVLSMLICALTLTAPAQDTLPRDKDKTKEKETGPTSPRKPKGLITPQKRGFGVLFVFTDPPGAIVTIKNSRGKIIQPQSNKSDKEGEFRAELSPGNYSIEVSADKFKPETKPASIATTRPEYVSAKLNPLYGSITLKGSFEPDVQVLIDGSPAGKINKSSSQIDLIDLPTGLHNVQIRHPAMELWEEKIEVKGGVVIPFPVTFKRKMASLVVKSEPGAMIFVDNAPKASLDSRGQATIADLEPGQHTVRAEKDLFEKSEQRINLVAGKQEALSLKLAPIAISPPFTETFSEGLKFWAAPSSWKVSTAQGNRWMTVNGPGMGFARNIDNDKRVYKDFTMTFALSFKNGKGAVWMIRARDEKNYYLFQLTGPKGRLQNNFLSYICQNGVIKQINQPMYVPVDLSKPDDTFHITIEVKGTTITHRIKANSDPKAEEPRPFSELPNVIITQGWIGFGTHEGEEFIVRSVSIIPNE
jgi:hypothetical protein